MEMEDDFPGVFDHSAYMRSSVPERRCLLALHQALILDRQIDQLQVRRERAQKLGQIMYAYQLDARLDTMSRMLMLFLKVTALTGYQLGWMTSPELP